MKKKQEYIPQFNFDSEEDFSKKDELIENYECEIFNDDVCFEYIRQNDIGNIDFTDESSSNEKLYNEWKNQRNKKGSTPFLLGLLWIPLRKYGFSAILFVFGIGLLIKGYALGIILFLLGGILLIGDKEIRHNKFLKFNDLTVEVRDDSTWICPSCKMVNDQLHHCERCGILPKFK